MPEVEGPNENSGVALAALRRLLQTERPRADGRLPSERDLARRLQAGRRAVRRALDVLEAEGLVWRRPGRGAYLGQTAIPARVLSEASELIEARLRLEPLLAGLAALRATPADVRQMRLLSRRTLAAGDADAAELWGGALHRFIARTAGNRPLLEAYLVLDDARSDGAWRRLSELRDASRPTRAVRTHAEHDAVIEAIAAADPDAAETAMRAHLLTLAAEIERLDRPLPILAAA